MVLYGGVWCCMVCMYNYVWCCMVLYGGVWCYMVLGVVCCCMVLYGGVWCCLGLYGVALPGLRFLGLCERHFACAVTWWEP